VARLTIATRRETREIAGFSASYGAERTHRQTLGPMALLQDGDMGFFSGRASARDDTRDREYVLTGCPLVTDDDMIVLVDLTVRIEVRRDREIVRGFDPAEETAWHAVVVLALRLLAEQVTSEELLVGRARIVEAVEHALGFSPIGAGVRPHVTDVEVRRHDPDAAVFEHEFRVLDT